MIAFALFVFLLTSADSSEIYLTGNFIQGGLVTGTVPPHSKVIFGGRLVTVSKNGNFLIGFSHNAAPTAKLNIVLPGEDKTEKILTIKQRTYKTQRIDGLPKKMVTPPKRLIVRIRAENKAISEARRQYNANEYFLNGWSWPVIGQISGVYGSRRILNGSPRQPHYGIDIAAPMGTPVLSPADGLVTLIHADMYYTGGTIILNHGHGLTSAMLHLDKINISLGDFVRKGEHIGTVGNSGRTTGPHLDWRINLFDTRLDPALLVSPMPNPK